MNFKEIIASKITEQALGGAPLPPAAELVREVVAANSEAIAAAGTEAALSGKRYTRLHAALEAAYDAEMLLHEMDGSK